MYIEHIKKRVALLNSLLWDEHSLALDIWLYAKKSGTMLVKQVSDDIWPNPDAGKLVPVWSDYQFKVWDDLKEKHTLLIMKIEDAVI